MKIDKCTYASLFDDTQTESYNNLIDFSHVKENNLP